MSKRAYLRTFDYDEARARREAGETVQSIAASLGVSPAAISRATNDQLRARMDEASSKYQAARKFPCATLGCTNEITYIGLRYGSGHCKSCSGRLANPPTAPCGTESAYRRGCRCNFCKAASADARRLRRHDAHPPKTHNRSGYSNGCRCDICRQAQREYHRNVRRAA